MIRKIKKIMIEYYLAFIHSGLNFKEGIMGGGGEIALNWEFYF